MTLEEFTASMSTKEGRDAWTHQAMHKILATVHEDDRSICRDEIEALSLAFEALARGKLSAAVYCAALMLIQRVADDGGV